MARRLGWYGHLSLCSLPVLTRPPAKQAASLNTLALAPILHYLHTYQPSHAPLLPTLGAYTAIELASVYLPLKFLRPSPQRRHSTDSTRTFTALLICSIYQLSVHLASNYFLTTYLLGAGWDLESTVRVHAPADAAVLIRGLLMLPIGYAASDVIFFTEDAAEKEDGEALRGLVGIVKGLWRKLSPRTRGIVKRTLAVVVYQTAGAVKSASSVKGGNWQGAAAMSGVWAASTLLVGAVLGWVGNVDL